MPDMRDGEQGQRDKTGIGLNPFRADWALKKANPLFTPKSSLSMRSISRPHPAGYQSEQGHHLAHPNRKETPAEVVP